MLGSGLLQAAMRDGNEVLLAAYVTALRLRRVPESDLQAEYDRLRQPYPNVPSLDELDRKRQQAMAADQPQAAESDQQPVGPDLTSIAEQAKALLMAHKPNEYHRLERMQGLDEWARMAASKVADQMRLLEGLPSVAPGTLLQEAFKAIGLAPQRK